MCLIFLCCLIWGYGVIWFRGSDILMYPTLWLQNKFNIRWRNFKDMETSPRIGCPRKTTSNQIRLPSNKLNLKVWKPASTLNLSEPSIGLSQHNRGGTNDTLLRCWCICWASNHACQTPKDCWAIWMIVCDNSSLCHCDSAINIINA
jgi:hypothetical protein